MPTRCAPPQTAFAAPPRTPVAIALVRGPTARVAALGGRTGMIWRCIRENDEPRSPSLFLGQRRPPQPSQRARCSPRRRRRRQLSRSRLPHCGALRCRWACLRERTEGGEGGCVRKEIIRVGKAARRGCDCHLRMAFGRRRSTWVTPSPGPTVALRIPGAVEGPRSDQSPSVRPQRRPA